jgi:hypothetical protein
MYVVKILALQGAPLIYDISRLRVNERQNNVSETFSLGPTRLQYICVKVLHLNKCHVTKFAV